MKVKSRRVTGGGELPCTKAREIDLAEFAVDPRAPAWTEFRAHYPGCPECSRAVASFSALASALRAECTGSSAHPSEEQLVALASFRTRLAPDELRRLDLHLAGCAPCRTEVAAVRGFDPADAAEKMGHVAVLDRLAAMITAGLRRPVFAAAVIAAILAIPATLLLRRPATEAAPPPTAPVAEVEPPRAPAVAMEPDAPAPSPIPAPAPTTPPAPAAPAARPEPAAIAAKPAKPPEPARPIEIAALLPVEPPQYAPGALASGPVVRVGDSARSLVAEVPPPVALGPAQVGATAHESPNLYWFLPDPTEHAIEVTLIEPSAPEPLLEVLLPGPHRAGVHRVSLADRGVRLRPGVDYQWFVALVRDAQRRSQDAVSSAAIHYAPPSGELASRLSAPPPGRAAHLLAEAGYWYDSFDQLSSWLATEHDDARLHGHRAALLDQVGLGDVAAFERR